MTAAKYADLTNFGFQLIAKGMNWKEYKSSQEDDTFSTKSYEIMPGVEIYYNNYRTYKHFSGKTQMSNFFQFSYSHSGLYESRISSRRKLRLAAGEVMLMTNIDQCYDSCMPMGFYSGFNIVFYPELFVRETDTFFAHFSLDIEQLFQCVMAGKSFAVYSCGNSVVQLLETLFYACQDGDIPNIKLGLLEILLQMSSNKAFIDSRYHYISDTKFSSIQYVKEYIEQDLTRHVTIKELSEIFGMSQTSIKDNFKAIYGYAPYEYLKRVRMNYAAELLTTTTMSVAEIGMQTGYENPSKFSSAFSKTYGLTPGTYRKIK